MLSLEKRYLEPLLPLAAGLDVVDLGCGTGRWLEILKAGDPRNLLGIDPSIEMLRQAKRKLKGAATLLCTDGGAAPLAPGSADLVLGNFVLSYVADAAAFLRNARTALRGNGTIFITDVHPKTSAALHWRRGVRDEDGFQEIQTFERSIDSIIDLCENAGLQVCARLEPCFGEAERELFAAAGKVNYFERAEGYPAIYILQCRRAPAVRGGISQTIVGDTISAIHNASLAIGPRERIIGTLRISDSRIETLGAESHRHASFSCVDASVDLEGFLLLPGLAAGWLGDGPAAARRDLSAQPRLKTSPTTHQDPLNVLSSPSGVPVPCASTKPTCAGGTPAFCCAARITASCAAPLGAVRPLLRPSWLMAEPRITARIVSPSR